MSTIPLARPLLGEEEAAASRRAILSGWVTQGPEVEAFEREWAAMTGAALACAVSSCTTALHLALAVLGIGPGDEVITVSHTFMATVNAVRYCGATPVMVDIDPVTFNITPAAIEAAITPRTKALLVVHQLGMPCDMKAIMDIAVRHQLRVVEDAACAIGSEICWNGEWQPVGRCHGDIVCFSLHPRKVITTGDGGMLTTNNAAWDEQFRLLRQHGMSVSDKARHNAREIIFESYPVLGYNYRMTDPQAAMGREQLKRLPGILARRRELAERYHMNLSGVGLPVQPDWARSNWQSYCVRLPAYLDQRQVMQKMLDAGVSTRRGVMCCHREEACADLPGPRHPLTHSEAAQDHCLMLPLFPQLTDAEQDRVIDTLHSTINA